MSLLGAIRNVNGTVSCTVGWMKDSACANSLRQGGDYGSLGWRCVCMAFKGLCLLSVSSGVLCGDAASDLSEPVEQLTGEHTGQLIDDLAVESAGTGESAETAELCPMRKLQQICAPATPSDSTVVMDCSLDFKQQDCMAVGARTNEITRKLLFHGSSASGITANFNGAHINAGMGQINHRRQDIIEIASTVDQHGRWQTPVNVNIRNALVTGSIRIFGMGRNGESPYVRQSSQQSGHIIRAQAVAPSQIHLTNLHVVGTGRNPVYFSPGVTDSSLTESVITGVSQRVGVYLDAETRRIQVRDNIFDVKTSDGSYWGFYDRGWPQVAVDGSAHNTISGNVFKRVSNGAIFLYRNCGEGGTIRYTTPSHNLITNNRFELAAGLDSMSAVSPIVFIGSRNYGLVENWMPGSHCNDDQQSVAYLGSAKSNADHASFNRVSDNVFVTMDQSRSRIVDNGPYIQVGNTRLDQFNVIEKNRLVGRNGF